MKFKHLLAGLTALSLVASAQATNILTENFDSFAALAGKGWAVQNNSDNPNVLSTWDQGNPGAAFNAQAGANDSYAGVNFASTNGNVIDNWLFTPAFALAAGEVVTFYTRSIADGIFPDNMEVRMSSNGSSTNVNDFGSLLFEVNPALTVDGFPSDWFKVQFTIPAFAGGDTGRLAFRYFLADASVSGDYIGIDTLNVVPEPATVMSLGIGMLALLAMRRRRNDSV
ncbi:MAG: choice-of-anchor J domain-containing protein [Pseudomonadota bacterium]